MQEHFFSVVFSSTELRCALQIDHSLFLHAFSLLQFRKSVHHKNKSIICARLSNFQYLRREEVTEIACESLRFTCLNEHQWLLLSKVQEHNNSISFLHLQLLRLPSVLKGFISRQTRFNATQVFRIFFLTFQGETYRWLYQHLGSSEHSYGTVLGTTLVNHVGDLFKRHSR